MSANIKNGAGAPSRRSRPSPKVRPEGGPSASFRHLAHLPSFRDNPIVFFTACTHRRRKILASAESEEILREIWQRSAEQDGWWVGHYIRCLTICIVLRDRPLMLDQGRNRLGCGRA